MVIVPSEHKVNVAALVRGINSTAALGAVTIVDALFVGEYILAEGEPATLFFVLAVEYQGQLTTIPRNMGLILVRELEQLGGVSAGS